MNAVVRYGIHCRNEVISGLVDCRVYNYFMLESVFQILAVYLFAATPCFAGWIANGGKREDVGIPILASIFLSLLFIVLLIFFR
jgi:hypothetical protein